MGRKVKYLEARTMKLKQTENALISYRKPMKFLEKGRQNFRTMSVRQCRIDKHLSY